MNSLNIPASGSQSDRCLRGAAARAAALLLCLFVAFCPATAEPAANEEDAEAIRRVATGMWEALGEQDLDAFRTFCSDDWELFTAAGNRFSAERLFEVHRENIRNFRLEATGMRVEAKGGLAWATYEAAMSGKRQGEQWGGTFLMTHVFERVDGSWQCVHTHESRKPEEN